MRYEYLQLVTDGPQSFADPVIELEVELSAINYLLAMPGAPAVELRAARDRTGRELERLRGTEYNRR